MGWKGWASGKGHHDLVPLPPYGAKREEDKEGIPSQIIKKWGKEINGEIQGEGKYVHAYVLRIGGITIYPTYKSFVLETSQDGARKGNSGDYKNLRGKNNKRWKEEPTETNTPTYNEKRYG